MVPHKDIRSHITLLSGHRDIPSPMPQNHQTTSGTYIPVHPSQSGNHTDYRTALPAFLRMSFHSDPSRQLPFPLHLRFRSLLTLPIPEFPLPPEAVLPRPSPVTAPVHNPASFSLLHHKHCIHRDLMKVLLPATLLLPFSSFYFSPYKNLFVFPLPDCKNRNKNHIHCKKELHNRRDHKQRFTVKSTFIGPDNVSH